MTHYFGYSPVGDKFWLKVFNDLRTRSVNDILIGVVDGLKGLAEAFESVPPGSKF